jgi:hypothetical protein
MDPIVARKMHRTLEPYHGMIYFVAEALDESRALGLDDRAAYFVFRSAVLGAVPADVVVATFYNFEPGLVRRSLDGVWEDLEPSDVVAARYRAADRALRHVLGEVVERAEMAEAATLTRRAASTLEPTGRPLFAAHAAVPWPEPPHLALWHAITLLREHRGDSHIAVLVGADIGACEALVLHAGTGEVPADVLRATRAWSDDAWGAAVARLADRGLVTGDGALTPSGRSLRDEIEASTDRLDLAPWAELGEAACEQLRRTVRPWSKSIVAAGTFGPG